MKPACIVRAHRAGLFSLINKVITCATIYEHAHVDFTGSLYGGGNIWNDLFRPTVPPEGDADVIEDYPDFRLTSANVAKLYEGDQTWRNECNAIWNAFGPRVDLLSRAERFTADHWLGQDTVAALIRCNGHRGEQVSDRSQSLDEYAAAFERVKRPGSILHVMAGDEESLCWFNERFQTTYCADTPRSPNRDGERHLTEPQTVVDAQQCFVEVAILSMARALIHPVSNLSTGALYSNPALESVYLK